MRPTRRTCRPKMANLLALFMIAALLLSGFGLPPAQAAPDAPQASTIIAVLSDYGSGEAVEQTVANMIAGWSPAHIVTAGDNYHYQNCDSYATCVGTYYGTYVAAQTFMPTLGNHDYGTLPMGLGLTAYNDYFSWLPTTADSQRRRYDFVAGDVHFFMLDGNRDQYTQAEWDNQTAWLQAAVAASTSAWNIAVLHQAPYSTGEYGDITASQLPYGEYGIDVVISGHNHHFEHLVKADGGKTVRYFIDGYGGSLPDLYGHSECGTSSTPATSEYCLANFPGAMKITASDMSITLQYYDSSGVARYTYEEVNGPEITTSTSSLDPFITLPGTPSAPQTYTVSGSLLTGGILISAPSGFEIKTDSGAYGPTITLPQTDGVVNPTTISVRLTGTTEGNFGGNITHASTGATQVDVAVSGYVGTAPICVTSRISASSDDAEQRNDTGAVDLDGDTSTHSLQTFRAYAGGSTGTLNWWGLRFLNVNVPPAATIASADITFRANLTSGTTASGMTLWGQLAANPATFTTSTNNVTSRTRTAASAAWDIPQWTSGSDYASPDLSGVVQEIVDQPDWAANNAMVVIGQTTVSQNRSAISRDSTNGSTLAPLLEVCYTMGPAITVSGTLAPFSTTPGLPSTAQTYTVSGKNLTADINIAAPEGFEIRTESGGYGSSLMLAQTDGSVPATTIYVRLTGAAEGSFDGNITHANTGAITRNVAVSGTVSLCTTASFQQDTAGYIGAADAYIHAGNATYNYGASTQLQIDSDDPYNSGNDVSTLLFWDISTIPAGSTINSASITVNVENVTDATPGYNMYAMTQGWTEGMGTGAAMGNGVTWNTYDGVNAWPGGAGGAGASDRGTIVLANFAAATTGSYQVTLSEAGKSVLAGWIAAPDNNKGFMIHAGTEDNGLYLTSKEGTTVANRPKLTVTYCLPPTTPYIVTSGTLSPFSSTINVPSAEQSYTVSGANLTSNIVITAPPDFQISTTSGSDFGTSVSLVPVSGTVAPTPIYVRFQRSTPGTSNGNITHTSTDATTRNVAVSGTIINGAPAVTLVQPVDDATNVGLAPLLEVNVTDPEAETMSVSFYGRPVSTSTPAEDFTLFVIPDTQSHVASSTLYVAFNAMTEYIVEQEDDRNVVFVTHVGDIVNTSSNTTEWQRADTAMDILDTGGVPYSVGPGNHDVAFGTTYYPDWFGSARFDAQSSYQGYYAAEGDNYSNYSLFSASGMDFILINLKYQPSTGALDWADGLLKTHGNRRGIVAQHDILNTNATWANQTTYNALSDNPNLFLIVCGHMHTASDGSAYRLETRTGMNPVHVLLTDYQDYNNAANTGYLRILTFRPASDAIYAEVYSPYVNAYLTNATNYEQFTMAYDMEGTAAAPFELIGTVNGVASGANATITWTGRDPDTEYEWYAVATDGTSSTTSTTWSFTTGTGTVAVPKAPVVTSIALSGSSDVDLTWDAVTEDIDDNSTIILEYHVYGSHDPYFTTGTLLSPSPANPTFTHTGGSTGDTNWYYLVRAFNSAGESADSPRRTGRFGFILVPGSPGN